MIIQSNARLRHANNARKQPPEAPIGSPSGKRASIDTPLRRTAGRKYVASSALILRHPSQLLPSKSLNCHRSHSRQVRSAPQRRTDDTNEEAIVSRRTFALLLLLVLAAGVAFHVRTAPEQHNAEAGAARPSDPSTPIAQPKHSRVDDEAQILAPFGLKLGRMADSFYQDLGVDIRIVTSTASKPSIEEQADQIFQQKRIGAGAPTGGLLVILNPTLASARIEVGYTLEGGLTDLHMGRIARDQLAPYASYGIAGMAVMDVLHYLRDHVYLSAALGNVTLNENYRNKPAYLEYEKFTSGGAGARTALPSLPADADLKRTVPSDLRARYAPSADMEGSVMAFLRATADLAGDPSLELFTEGSRLMRAHYPLAQFEERKRLERLEASRPLEFIVRGDHAVATSKRPAHGFVPVLLHREQGLWRIDLVETFKNLFFDNEGNYSLRNSNTPYAFGLTQFGDGRYYDIPATSLAQDSIALTLAAMDGRRGALSDLQRGEIWLRNAFVFPQAFLAYEAARRAAPEDPLVLQTLGDRALYLGFPELAIPSLERIGQGVELSLAEAYNELNDAQGAHRWVSRALEENPYDMYALQWLQFLARKDEHSVEARRANETIAALSGDAELKANPVVLYFDPAVPKFERDATVDVNGTEVFDHSRFAVTIRNTSNRPVEIESVTLTSMGNADPSGLGDIKTYWRFPAGPHRLSAGESAVFRKVWGFTVDTGHEHVRYVFRTCWRGVGSAVRQCRTQWVDALP
jgi:TPM domain